MREATELPFVYRKLASMFKDQNANVARDFRLTKKEVKIVGKELSAKGIIIIKKPGHPKIKQTLP